MDLSAVDLGAWPLRGRDHELRILAAETSWIITGPPGMGKTTLVSQVAEQSGPSCWVRGVRALKDVRLGAVIHDIEEAEATLSAPGSMDRLAALLATAETETLVVDDAQFLDETTAALIERIAVARPGLRVLATARVGEALPESIAHLVSSGRITSMPLEPLDRGAVHALLEDVLGGAVQESLTTLVLERSGGNPMYIRHLVTDALVADQLRQTGGRWRSVGHLPAPPQLPALIASHLPSLPDHLRETLEVCVLADRLSLGALDDEDEVRQLVELGYLSVDRADSTVCPAHSVVAAAVVEGLDALGGRAQRLRAAALLANHDASARSRCRQIELRLTAGDSLTSDELYDATVLAYSTGDLPLAARCGQLSQQQESSFRIAHLNAKVHLRLGDYTRASVAVAEAKALSTTPHEQTLAAQSAAQIDGLGLDTHRHAKAVIDDAWASSPGEQERDLLRTNQASLLLYEGKVTDALDVLDGAIDRAVSPLGLGPALVTAAAHVFNGSLDKAVDAGGVVRDIAASLPPDHPLGDRVFLDLFRRLELMERGEIDRAVDRLERWWARREPGRYGLGTWAIPMLLGRASIVAGRPAAAMAWLEEALHAPSQAPPTFERWIYGLHALAAVHVPGEDASPPALGGEMDADGAVRATAAIQAHEGHVREAAALLIDVAEDARSTGSHMMEAGCLHDAVRYGVARPAVVDRLVNLAERAGDAALPRARAAHAQAVAKRDPAALLVVGEQFAAMGARLFAADAIAQAAQRFEAVGETRPATRAAVQLRTLCEADEPLRSVALERQRAPSPLTPRELVVARMAARGMSAKQIGSELHVSWRTVDNNLHRVYTKLGLDGRADLQAGLDALETPPGR